MVAQDIADGLRGDWRHGHDTGRFARAWERVARGPTNHGFSGLKKSCNRALSRIK